MTGGGARGAVAGGVAGEFVCTVRREVTDRLLILNEHHLRAVLDRYATHHNHPRPHRALQLAPPRSDQPKADLRRASIRRRPASPRRPDQRVRTHSSLTRRSDHVADFWNPTGDCDPARSGHGAEK
ncbi:transposase [Saccharothrix sp. NRRL B-16314]|uniref:transposase n=1 Tax=Saccharothrix sp. NRRL B-16314 TaxID=1463825 RepID=UPI001E655A47|nr:transposase [Saccharothrix sp. NRRL B-16314]